MTRLNFRGAFKKEAGMKPASNPVQVGSGKTDRNSIGDAGYGGVGGLSIRDLPKKQQTKGKVPREDTNISTRFGTEFPTDS